MSSPRASLGATAASSGGDSWSSPSRGVLEALHASAVAQIMQSSAASAPASSSIASEAKRPRGRPRKRPREDTAAASLPEAIVPTFSPPETLLDACMPMDDDLGRLRSVLELHARKPGQVVSHDEARLILQIYERCTRQRMEREGLAFRAVRSWGVTFTHKLTGMGFETVRKVVDAATRGGALYAEDTSRRGGANNVRKKQRGAEAPMEDAGLEPPPPQEQHEELHALGELLEGGLDAEVDVM